MPAFAPVLSPPLFRGVMSTPFGAPVRNAPAVDVPTTQNDTPEQVCPMSQQPPLREAAHAICVEAVQPTGIAFTFAEEVGAAVLTHWPFAAHEKPRVQQPVPLGHSKASEAVQGRGQQEAVAVAVPEMVLVCVHW